MKYKINLVFIICTIIGTTCTNFVAAATKNIWPSESYTWKGQFAWTKDPWTGDNTPYHAARLEIEKVSDNQQKLIDLRQRYERDARKKPNDPMSLFRLAYTIYESWLKDNTNKNWSSDFGLVHSGYFAVESPHTYDYDRVHYLVWSFYGDYVETIPIARRMLNVDPDDYYVAAHLAASYLNGYPAKINEALAICQHLKKQYPQKASIYSLIGEAYVLWYHRDGNPANAKAVVENYEKYLSLAPPNEPFRKRAKQIIEQYKPKMKR